MRKTTLFTFLIGGISSVCSQALTDTPNGVGVFQTNPQGALHVVASNMTGMIVDHTATGDFGFGILLTTDRDLTKAFSHMHNGTENFILWGNGVVNATKIYSREIEVRADAMGLFWPDYVFKPDYTLRSIPELKKYVDAHHHLPEFPSAGSLDEAGGYDLTVMITALLSTVEQQALYIIEMNERLAALEALQTPEP